MRIALRPLQSLGLTSLLVLTGCSDPLSDFEGVWREYCQNLGTGYILAEEEGARYFSLVGGAFMFMRGKAEVSNVSEGEDGSLTIIAGRHTASLTRVSDAITELQITGKSFKLRKCEN